MTHGPELTGFLVAQSMENSGEPVARGCHLLVRFRTQLHHPRFAAVRAALRTLRRWSDLSFESPTIRGRVNTRIGAGK